MNVSRGARFLMPVLLGALLAGVAHSQTITAIELTVRPETGGTAFVAYAPGGNVRGGHLSGDSVPFVHQANGRIGRDADAAIWRAAQALGDSVLARQDGVPSSGRGYNRLQIERRGREMSVVVWPFGTEHPDPRVRSLVSLLMAHRVGGW